MKANFDFRKKILIVFFIALPFILFNSCEHLLDAPSIPNEKTVVGGAISAPTGLKASQGLKRKIVVSWNAVEGAKRYYIYMASNPNEEFVQVGETAEISYEIKVSPGTTDYYRVVAEKADKTRSPISVMSNAGASLALPVFSGANVEEGKVTVYWDMENADYYRGKLRFEVKQEDTATGMATSREVSGNEDFSCTFEDLNSNSKYIYSIDAYLTDSPDEKENSGKTTVATMALRRPQPPKFTASEGGFKDKIRLSITLPPKVQVSSSSDLGSIIETSYPVYFEISRKRGEKGSYEVIEKELYYDGSLPTAEKKGAASGYDDYVAGKTLVWDDTKFTEQDRGVKYEYKIKSYVDYNFSPQNGSPKVGSRESEPCTGWMSQRPKFTVGGKMSGEQYSVNLGIVWDAMGKGDEYKFAIKLEKKEASVSAGNGEESWLANANGENFFVASTKELEEKYAIDERMYCYTLYVVKKSAEIENATSDENLLEAVAASPVLVADPAKVPESKFSVDDGYSNKVVLKLDEEAAKKNGSDVSYKFVRKLNGEEITIENGVFTGGGLTYTDGSLAGGKKYEYVMYATKNGSSISVPSEPKDAITLGKPEPNIVTEGDGKKKLGYDTIDLEMYEVFGAKSYCLTLGESGGFGGGQTLVFDAAGKKTSGNMDADISLVDQKFAITIKKPHGYNDATLAGNVASLVVAARGYTDATGNADKNSEGTLKDAKVMGPAMLKVSGTKENGVATDKITLTWNKVDDAAGYAIVRKRAGDDNNDVFYVDNSDDPKVSLADKTAANASLCENVDVIEVKCKERQYTFVDKGYDTFDSKDSWYANQQKIGWGYEYTYTVLPLLAEGDAGQMLGNEGTGGFKVKYEGLNESNKKVASGYTYGYGLDVKASKADYANKIKVSWDMPKYARDNDATFKLYYRKADGAWKSYGKSLTPKKENGKAEVEFIVESPDDSTEKDAQTEIGRNDIMEYAVKYNSVDDNFKGSYVQYLASTKDGNTGEPINRGYCFALTADADGFEDVSDHKNYEEKLRWTRYPKDRAVGPDGYRLYVKNHNLSNEWYRVANFDKDGRLIVSENPAEDNIEVSEGATSSDSVSRITIVKPKDVNELGGRLKVLRDYKHYYRLEAYRNNSDNIEIRTSMGGSGADYNTTTGDGITRNGYDYGDTRSIYAYRQITDEELVRAATLAMAYGVQQTQTTWETQTSTKKYSYTASLPGEGITEIESSGGTVAWSKLNHAFSFDNFAPALPTKAREYVTFLMVYGDMKGTTGDGGSKWQYYAPRKYIDGSFTVKPLEDCRGLYNATMTISDLSVNSSNSGITIEYESGARTFGNITPFVFGNGNNKFAANPLNDGDEQWQ